MSAASGSRRDALLIFAIWLAGLGSAGQYAKVSVVYDRLPAHYPVDPAALGWVVSIVGLVGIVFGAASGGMVARAGFRRALLVALWAGALFSVLQALMPPLPIMLALRVLEGVSHLAIVVAAPTIIAQLAPDAWRGFAMSLWSTFFSVAFSLLVVFGLPLADRAGVGGLFLAHALWMAACAALLHVPLKRMPALPKPAGGPVRPLRDMAALYRSPFTAAPAVGWLFYTFCYLSLLTLLPDILPPENRAFVLGLMPLISIVTSMTVGVWAMRVSSAVAVVITGFALSLGVTAALIVLPPWPALCFALAAALGLIQSATFAAVPELNASATDRARANGALAQMGNLGNTLGTPVLAWVLLAGGASWMMAAATAIFGLGVAAHLVLAAARRRAARTG